MDDIVLRLHVEQLIISGLGFGTRLLARNLFLDFGWTQDTAGNGQIVKLIVDVVLFVNKLINFRQQNINVIIVSPIIFFRD